LFAAHPVAVESVAWISELKNVLSGSLFLAAALAWLWYDEGRRARSLALSIALFMLACLAKGSVVMLPVALAGVVVYRRGRLGRRDLAALAPLFAVALAAGVVNLWFQQHNALAQGWGPSRGLVERLGGAGWALAFYLRTAFLPAALGFVHAPWGVAPGSPLFLVPSALLLSGTALLIALRRRWTWVRPVCAGLAYHAVMVLPILGLVDLAYFRVGPVSNHLQYLALMGPVALLAASAAVLTRRSRLAVPTAAAAALAFGLGSCQRGAEFHDDGRLWAAAVLDAPGNAFAHGQLAFLLSQRGDVAGARSEFAAAAEAAVEPASRHMYRSWWLSSLGRPGEAAAEAHAALASTSNPEVRHDAAEVLLRTGGSAEALSVARELVAAAPASSEYTYLLANALWRERRANEAVDVLRTFCRDHPGEPEMEKALGIVLARVGRLPEAYAHAAAIAGVEPGDPRAKALLARWLEEPPSTGR
ncbi:MAG TPA: tetratricopeptide repeat protein, partial [Anaeromyxobacteraceae bacterium]